MPLETGWPAGAVALPSPLRARCCRHDALFLTLPFNEIR